jgi:Xaa-Pro aminopeptidase
MNPIQSQELPILIHANPHWVSDLYYLSGLMAPDPYSALLLSDKLILAVSPLEYGRAMKFSKADEVLDIQSMQGEARRWLDKGHPSEAANILQLLDQYGVREVQVTRDFPYFIAESLVREGITLKTYEGALLRERICKSREEVVLIRDAIRVTQECLARVRSILEMASIDQGLVVWEGEVLTSERIQLEIAKVCMENGYDACDPIVACGDQACDPHEKGHGPIHANQLIIVDIFPRSQTHHYWGDLTRTFLKGRPTEQQTRLVRTVAEAQRRAIDLIRAGAITGEVHQAVERCFQDANYVTEKKDGVYQGFFHGTGHGFGLDIHEAPRLGKQQKVVLEEGMVVTVEPGLYFPGVGGCRIEDDILVQRAGCEVLSCFPYDWVIP